MIRSKCVLSAVLLILAASAVLSAQTPQVVAVRAGRMFDPKSGTNLTNQVVLISGDRITDVGPADRVKVPAGARVIDLSHATVLPGLTDGHVHLTHAGPDCVKARGGKGEHSARQRGRLKSSVGGGPQVGFMGGHKFLGGGRSKMAHGRGGIKYPAGSRLRRCGHKNVPQEGPAADPN